MSVIDERCQRVILERHGVDEIWSQIQREYIKEKPHRARQLGMLALREVSGWTIDMVADAFGQNRGHVARTLTKLRRELQETFDAPEGYWGNEV